MATSGAVLGLLLWLWLCKWIGRVVRIVACSRGEKGFVEMEGEMR